MRHTRIVVLVAIMLGFLGIAAGRQLAMRVEVTTLRPTDGGTLTEVAILIAPEDRDALGEDVMVWVELSRKEVRILRRGWAMKIDDPTEGLRVEIVVPEGDHVLRVDIEGSAGRAVGVWWGDVDVAVAPPSPALASEPTPLPDKTSGSDQRKDLQSASAAETAVGAKVATATEESVEAGPEKAVAAAVALVVEAEEEPTTPMPVPEPQPEPTPAFPDPAVIEPTEVWTDRAPPPTMDLNSVTSSQGEITVVVTRRGEPVTGLTVSDLVVRAGRRAIALTALHGPEEAPLRLGLVVDLAPESSRDLPWIGRMLTRVAERGDRGGGMVFVRNRDSVAGGWKPAPFQVGESIAVSDAAGAGDLPTLLGDGLDPFSSIRGRAFLILVTDGRRPFSGGGWKEAFQLAQHAGVPILVAGIWHEDFGSGVRKDLRKLADLSGGSVFYVQGPEQLNDLVDRFGAVLDGSYAATVDASPGTTDVVVSLLNAEADVRASITVR